jgi:hypothetical protein
MTKNLKLGLGIGLLGLAVIVLVILNLLVKPKSTNDVTSKQVESQASLAQIITNLKSNLRDYGKLTPMSTSSRSTIIGYRFPSQDFEVMLPSTYTLSYGTNNLNSETSQYYYLGSTLKAISSTLKKDSFGNKENVTPTNTILSSTYFYASKTDICEINIYTDLDIACAAINNLMNISQTAAPLVSLYLTQATNEPLPSVNKPVITLSQTAGYQTASLVVYDGSGETKVNYYKTASSAWQIVNLGWYNDPHEDGDIIPNCIDFESKSAVRLAFLGTTCYDSTSQGLSTIH